MRRLLRSLRLDLLTLALAALVGCGQTEIADLGESSLDVLPIDVGADGGLQADTTGGVDSGAGGDIKGGECSSKYDCLKRDHNGVTPCTLPVCDNGYCKTEPRAVDAECVDPLVVLKPCQQTRCNAKAECEAVDRSDGVACADPNVAVEECQVTTCKAGECQPADKEDGTVCGVGACTECKAGKCSGVTSADLDDGNPCTNDYCDANSGKIHEKITDLTVPCDDDKACTGGGNCVLGVCEAKPLDCDDGVGCTVDLCDEATGCTHKVNDTKCSDDDPCVNVACDLAQGCTATTFNPGKACNDGDSECTKDDKCTATGACVGTPSCGCVADADCLDDNGQQKDLCRPVFCVKTGDQGFCVVDQSQALTCTDDGGECADNVCDPKTGECGYVAKNEDKECNDFNKCTDKSVCKDGQCVGEAVAGKCDDKNPCTLDSCAPDTGCNNEPASGPCDDGNPCTDDDGCSKGGCTGTAKTCDDGIGCTGDTCDGKTGKCSNTPDAKSCDDGNPCTTDACDDQGQAGKKGCTHTADDKAACSDGDKCTIDGCKSGDCVAKGYDKTKPGCGCVQDAECDDKNPCTVDRCAQGDCTYDPAGKDSSACETGSLCHVAKSGVCKAGACTGGKPKDCSGTADKCHSAQCNPKTGKCDKLQKPDKTPCDADGSFCTVGDACQKGVCTVGEPKVCKTGDQCSDALCNAKNGACTKKPKAKGTACEDDSICTAKDTCDGAGKCAAGKPVDCTAKADACNKGVCDQKVGCVAVSKGAGVACNDGQFCTKTDKCAESTVEGRKVGKCVGSGAPVCKADASKCKVAYCDPKAGGKCATKAAAPGAPCSDGSKCTLNDRCGNSGTCKPGVPRTCSGDACNDPICTPSTGACGKKPKANGTKCSDGNLCTRTDTCQGGVCKGSHPKTCPGDACNVGACTPGNGACTKKPKKNGTTCSDGQACTGKQGDACLGGVCKPGTWWCTCKVDADCNDKKACTKDRCATSATGTRACKNTPMTGSSCNDGNACTPIDKCTSAGECKGTARNCDDKKACTLDSCDTKTGNCLNNAISGAKCSDDKKCTIGDICSGSTCVGKAIVCNDRNACTDDSCNPTNGNCQFVANSNACSDGDACTVPDRCYSKACKAGPKKNCSDGTKCTTDKCNHTTGKCGYTNAYEGSLCEKGSYSMCSSGKCMCRNWQVTVGNTNSAYREALYDVKLSGNYLVSVGYSRYYNGKAVYYYGFATKHDRVGRLIFARQFSYGSASRVRVFRGLTRNTKDKRWVAVGYYDSGTKYLYDGWIVGFDDKGYQRRAAAIRPTGKSTYGGTKQDYLMDVAEDSATGEYYVAGYSYSFGTRYGAWLAKVRKYSSYGFSVVWSTGRPSNTYYSQYLGVAYDPTYKRVLAAGWTGTSNNADDGLISAYTNSGASGWYKSPHRLFGGANRQHFSDIITYGGMWQAVGYSYSTIGKKVSYNGWRHTGFSSSGIQYQSKVYGGDGHDYFDSIGCYGPYCFVLGRYRDMLKKKNRTWLQRVYYRYASNTYSDYKFDLAKYPSSQQVAPRSTTEIGISGYYGGDGVLDQVSYTGQQVCK